ncbi:hypothetical protein ACFLRT_05385 [Acidobacteriota bacterium]
MTQAVCINCGEIKWGAFNPCQKCKKEPKAEDDLALSLAFSDHHFSFKELKGIGERIKNGEKLQLDPQQKAQISSIGL